MLIRFALQARPCSPVGSRLLALAFVFGALSPFASLRAQQPVVALLPIAKDLYLWQGAAGNSVVAVSKPGIAIVGPQLAAEQAALAHAIAGVTPLPVRFVMLTGHPTVDTDRDANWARAGAITIVEEHTGYRIGKGLRDQFGKNAVPLSAPAMATLGFSEVQQIHLTEEDIHVVRQKPGNTSSDISAHFEEAKVIYLGESVRMDAYPTIDEAHGGSLNGLIETSAKFMSWPATTKFVPGHGNVLSPFELKTYHDMLVAVRDRVKSLKESGQSLDAIVAARPSAAFDDMWKADATAAKALVTAAYKSLEAPAAK